jgi:transposase InsO family protein
MASWEQYLKKIYYNSSNPASFAGPDKLYRFVRNDGKFVLSKYKIKKWLQRQEPYSQQRPIKRPVKRNRVVVIGIDDQWDIDLMYMTKFSKYNRGKNFILVAIDIFSKFVWLRPLKDKRGESVMKALKSIFAEGRSPSRKRTDKGQEFRSRLVKSLLRQRRIEHVFAQNTEIKANYVERVIKTIKSKMYRYFTHAQSYNDIEELQKFAGSYNKTYHRTIGMPPNKVTKGRETNMWWKMYWPKKVSIESKRQYGNFSVLN